MDTQLTRSQRNTLRSQRAQRRKKEYFWSYGLSLDESRVSLIMISFVIFSALALYMYLFIGDIPETLRSIIMTLIAGIAGANAVGRIISYNQQADEQYYNDHYNDPL